MAQLKVFVSHSHRDNAFTDRLVADLQAAGADVWVDTTNIPSDDFIKKINEGLVGRQWLVLVMSPDALRSGFVQMEVNAALNQAIRGRMRGVIPIMAKHCDPDAIPPTWATLHRYDATANYGQALSGLMQALGLAAVSQIANEPYVPQVDSSRPSSKRACVLAIASPKGGVGKTTTTINLAHWLAFSERKTLVVDLNGASGATSGLIDYEILRTELGSSVYNPLVGKTSDQRSIFAGIRAEVLPNLSVLPGTKDLYAADIELLHQERPEYRLKQVLDQIKASYDFVLIDCPPALDLLVTNALVAADGIIYPLQCEYFAMQGLGSLLAAVRDARDKLGSQVTFFGIAYTMYRRGSPLSEYVVAEVSRCYPQERFQTAIPWEDNYSCIDAWPSRSSVVAAYRRLAAEVMERAPAPAR